MPSGARRGWEIPEGAVTPEAVFLNRRGALRTLAGTTVSLGASGLLAASGPTGSAVAEEVAGDDPSAGLYPVARNERYRVDQPVTPESWVSTYNNFFEFGSSKRIQEAAQALVVRPWTVTVDGLIETPRTFDIDELLAAMPLEERVCRHRCVEAWAMIVPWSGFPMKALLDRVQPLGSAKYVVMETFLDSEMAPGQRAFWYPWPYVEGLTIAEAANELAFLVTGAYGKPLPKQNGAPLRLAVPWKYGFKHIKSIRKITFAEERPATFWARINEDEYGFWANVNPKVPHPRWSQATERLLGSLEERPTELFNGYAEYVAHLYDGLEGERLFT